MEAETFHPRTISQVWKKTNGIIVHKQLQMEAFYKCNKSQSSQDIY
jgi:hypothetical protein